MEMQGINANKHKRMYSIEENDYASAGYDSSQYIINADTENIMATKVPPRSVNLIKEATIYKKTAAEFLSTFILVLAGCGGIMVETRDKVLTHVGVAAVFGLTIMAMIYAVGHISGAHMNPAVSIAFSTVGKLPLKQLPVYILAQLTGATLAAAALRLTIANISINVAVNVPAGNDIESLLYEFMLTFILMFVLSAMATDPKAPGQLIGVVVGGTIGFCSLFGGPLSGASLNPARSFGPALMAPNFDGLWVYIVGPILGALCGAWTYIGIMVHKE